MMTLRRDRLLELVPYTGVFAHGLGQSIVFATLPPLGREIGLQEVAIGAIISASSLVFFVFSRIWGRISDHWGRKPVIIFGLCGYTVGTLAFALLFGLGMKALMGGTLLYVLIMGTRMIQAMLMSGTAPGTAAYIADITTPLTRTAGMGRLAAANNIGSILGPAIAGTLAALSLLLPLVFAALATALAALLTWRLLPASTAAPHSHRPRQKLRFFDRRISSFLLLGMVMFTGLSIVQQTLAFRIQDTLMLDTRRTAQLFGYTMMVSAAASLFAQVVLVQRLKFAPVLLLRIGIPLLLVAFSSLIWSASLPAFMVTMLLIGLGLGLCGPGVTAATSLAVSAAEQGAAAGITTAMPALGFIIGPVAGTGLYQLNPVYPYVLTSVILLPAAILVFRLKQHLHAD